MIHTCGWRDKSSIAPDILDVNDSDMLLSPERAAGEIRKTILTPRPGPFSAIEFRLVFGISFIRQAPPSRRRPTV